MSYLPATEEEPMALWKVRLDTDAVTADKATEKARFHDLEDHELHDAIKKFK